MGTAVQGLQNRPSERPVKRNQSLLQGLDEAIQRIRLANGPRRTLAEAKVNNNILVLTESTCCFSGRVSVLVFLSK